MAAKQSIPQTISDQPEIKYLNRYVRGKLVAACAQNPVAWKDVGRELLPGSGSDVDTALNIIEVNSQGNVIKCCSSLFDQWLERDPDASWEHLIEALNIALLDKLATKIEGMLQPSADSIHKIETAKPQLQTATASGSSDHGSVLAQKVGMYELMKIVIPKVKAQWQNLAYAMKYDIGVVHAIDKDGRDLEERCKNLFTNWLVTDHGPTPKTYETLLNYIKKINELTAAHEEIKKELIKDLSD